MTQSKFRFPVLDSLIRSVALIAVLTTCFSFASPMFANDGPAIALTNAKVVTSPGDVIESGTVVCRNGLIESVGADIEIPFDAKVIDCAGMVVYAGFIDAGTSKGLPDEENDGRQTGSGPDRASIDLATQIAASTREVKSQGNLSGLLVVAVYFDRR